MLQTAVPGILVTMVGIGTLLLGVRALTAQALEGNVTDYEIRIAPLGLHVRWSKTASSADENKGIDPPSAQGTDPPADAPEQNGGGGKT
ncbi:hypothetical protein AB0J43_16665 [Nonomuraea fuscirosea]